MAHPAPSIQPAKESGQRHFIASMILLGAFLFVSAAAAHDESTAIGYLRSEPDYTILVELYDFLAQTEPTSPIFQLDDPKASLTFFALSDTLLEAQIPHLEDMLDPQEDNRASMIRVLFEGFIAPLFAADNEDRPIQLAYGPDWWHTAIVFYDEAAIVDRRWQLVEPGAEVSNGMVYPVKVWDDNPALPTMKVLIESVTERAEPDFQLWVQALETADLLDTLDDPEVFTSMYAPIDSVFEVWLERQDMTFDDLLVNEELLTSLLLIHMTEEPTEVFGELQDFYPSRLGYCLSAIHYATDSEISSMDEDGVSAERARFRWHDIPASNGILHGIDGVIPVPTDAPSPCPEL